PLPTRPGHVHAYLLPGDDGWIVVDTGIGLPDAKETWAAELEQIGGRVATIFVTHFHPDHVGAAADLHELTGAPVVQGALDYAQCELVWGNPAWSERLVEWFGQHGAPAGVTDELVGQSSAYRPFIRYQRDPILVEAGERVDGWELIAASGHADGQLCLLKDDVLIAADLHELTGAPVHQGALDYAQCELVWGNPAWSERLVDWFRLQGAPDDVTAELVGYSSLYRPFIRYQRDPVLMEAGERLDGWELVAAPGHADGQLCLLKDGVLVAADHILGRITPTVGLWPASRPDPLGDYLEALERTIDLEPTVALPGHGDPVDDPAERARELQKHHRVRLGEAVAALAVEPKTGYELSFALFGEDLKPAGRRFAVAETLSHLEWLVHDGAAARAEVDGTVTYTSA
ncbi:MAG: MBL fold metallo-hydrolase, partial [Gaiellaceae bacterium]